MYTLTKAMTYLFANWFGGARQRSSACPPVGLRVAQPGRNLRNSLFLAVVFTRRLAGILFVFVEIKLLRVPAGGRFDNVKLPRCCALKCVDETKADATALQASSRSRLHHSFTHDPVLVRFQRLTAFDLAEIQTLCRLRMSKLRGRTRSAWFEPNRDGDESRLKATSVVLRSGVQKRGSPRAVSTS